MQAAGVGRATPYFNAYESCGPPPRREPPGADRAKPRQKPQGRRAGPALPRDHQFPGEFIMFLRVNKRALIWSGWPKFKSD